MTDEERIQQVVALAISAAGPMGDRAGAWKGKINDLIPEISIMLHPQSAQARRAASMLNAVFLTGDPTPVYLGYELEASSTRLLVSFKTKIHPKWNKEGVDTLRSERTDSQLGQAQKRLLDQMSPGQECLVWKIDEEKGDGEKVRILGHVVPLGTKVSTGVPAPVDGGSGPPAAPPREAPSPVPPTGDGGFAEKLTAAMVDLSNPQKKRVADRARARGLWPASDETIDQLIVIVEEIRKAGF